MKKPKLKPCPFCKCSDWMAGFMTNHYAMPRHLYWIECCACNAHGPEMELIEKAKIAWNRRVRSKP